MNLIQGEVCVLLTETMAQGLDQPVIEMHEYLNTQLGKGRVMGLVIFVNTCGSVFSSAVLLYL